MELPGDPHLNNTFQLCLIITEKCNLNCSYCYCDKSKDGSMTFELASREIDHHTGKLHESVKLHILLMGGEPFLEFQLIRQLVDYVDQNYSAKKILFKAVTNGTLVHGEIQEWLRKHQHCFRVELSLDGPDTIQDRQRSSSFDRIDVDFFKELPRPTVSTVVSPASMPCMAENIQYLANEGFYVKAVLADGVEWKRMHLEVFAAELRKLAEYFLLHPDLYPVSFLAMATYGINSDFNFSVCEPGETSVSVGPGGEKFACHRCSEYYNTANWNIPEESMNLKVKYLDKACEDCCVRDICNACPASIVSLKNNKEQSEIRCMITKIMFMASAYFQVRLLTEFPSHIYLSGRSTMEKSAILKGSRLILETLDPTVPF